MTVEDIARVCHEVNRAYCRSIGDDSQVSWGPVKLVEFRQHPCIMPYEELPRDQRVKDHLFRAVVKILTQDEP